MKYLVVYDSYTGKYYNGEFTVVYDSLVEAVKAIKEPSVSLKFKKLYTIGEEIKVKLGDD